MKYTLSIALICAGAIFLQFCSSSKQASSSNAGDAGVTYAADVAPIIEGRCTPCHFPDGGDIKFLDTYKSVKNTIDDIIVRVELEPGSDGFMPPSDEPEPLTAEQIQTLKDWRDAGMAK